MTKPYDDLNIMMLNRFKLFLFLVWLLLVMSPLLIGSVEGHFLVFSAFADETYSQDRLKFPEQAIPNNGSVFNLALKSGGISDNKSHPVVALFHGQISFPISNTSEDAGAGPTLLSPFLKDQGNIFSFFSYRLIPDRTSAPENDHKFDGFIQGLQQKIKAKWQPPDNDHDHQIIVRFEVNRKGEVSHFKYLKASSNSEANRRALEAVYNAAPFLGFPDSYEKEFVNVEFVFDFKVHHPGAEDASRNTSKYKDILGYGESHQGWKSLRTFQLVASHPPISLKIYVEQNPLENNLYKPSYLQLVSESLQEWQNALNNRFSCQWVNSAQDSDIQINWVDSFSEKGKTKEDLKYYVGRTLPAIGKAIIRIRPQKYSEPQVKRIILHELGHALGLSVRNSHSLDPDDIMSSGGGLYRCGFRLIPSPHLSIRDKAAIQRLYSSQWEKGEDLYQAISAQYPSKISQTSYGNCCR